jgi:non-homologous end joining protein Ku
MGESWPVILRPDGNGQQSPDSFDPAAYPDEVKARVEEAIQRKVQGERVTVTEPRPAVTSSI